MLKSVMIRCSHKEDLAVPSLARISAECLAFSEPGRHVDVFITLPNHLKGTN